VDIYAVIAQKGGTGKTTLTVSLAVAAQRSGKTSAIVDLDPQASASSWSDRREEEMPVVVSAQPARLPQVLDAARATGAEVVYIDTPPRAEQASMAAARAADLVLIPCRPAVYDLETVATTLDLVRFAGGPPTAVILNGVPPRGSKRADAEAILRDQGAAVAPVVFGNRVAFDHAGTLGLSAQEYEPAGKAASEIQQVYLYTSALVQR
jgi:chromosome partitioning protein